MGSEMCIRDRCGAPGLGLAWDLVLENERVTDKQLGSLARHGGAWSGVRGEGGRNCAAAPASVRARGLFRGSGLGAKEYARVREANTNPDKAGVWLCSGAWCPPRRSNGAHGGETPACGVHAPRAAYKPS